MANVALDLAEGTYYGGKTAKWVLSSNVSYINFTLNGPAPAMSKYIAYDTLTPPNPFIAVTQDGKGNVVYDGGFPKFLNQYAPPAGIDPYFSMEFRGTNDGSNTTGNAYYYNAFSDLSVTIAAGDKLVYDIYQNSADARVGIDAVTNLSGNGNASNTYSLRDWNRFNGGVLLADQNGLSIHPATDLGTRSVTKWYHREFDLTPCAGYTFLRWSLAYEGEIPGTFYARFKEVYVVDKNGNKKATLFKDVIRLPGNSSTEAMASGYSNLSKLIYDPRAQLTASWKYLFNAIRWCANEDKVWAGNKKVLILGNTRVSDSYPLKGTGNAGFITAFNRLFSALGYTPTYMDLDDFTSGQIEVPLATLDQYTCAILISSSTNVAVNITDAGVSNLVAFREAGNGLIIITDHGPVFNDISEVAPASGAFFNTANKLAVEFGTYFSGNYNRTPVNVGTIRSTYGDHPLYAGMADTENIQAGSSESQVVVQQYPQYTSANAPTINMPDGIYAIKAVALLKDGNFESYTFNYTVMAGELIKLKDRNGTLLGSTLNVGFYNNAVIEATLDIAKYKKAISGNVLKNGSKVGTLAYTVAGGSVQGWDTDALKGNLIPVKNGDTLSVQITTPFAYTKSLTLVRSQPDIGTDQSFAGVMKKLRGVSAATGGDVAKLKDIMEVINNQAPWLRLPPNLGLAKRLDIIRDYLTDTGEVATILPQAVTVPYATAIGWQAAGNEANWYKWVPNNPVTGEAIDFKYVVCSPKYLLGGIGSLMKQSHYNRLYIPAGDYIALSYGDDRVNLYLDDTQLFNQAMRGTNRFTVPRSKYWTLEVRNTNDAAAAPMWWTMVILNAGDGSIFYSVSPNHWRIKESPA